MSYVWKTKYGPITVDHTYTFARLLALGAESVNFRFFREPPSAADNAALPTRSTGNGRAVFLTATE